jgi:hypothetical protein
MRTMTVHVMGGGDTIADAVLDAKQGFARANGATIWADIEQDWFLADAKLTVDSYDRSVRAECTFEPLRWQNWMTYR